MIAMRRHGRLLRRGLTLLELMLAITIFALVSVTILAVFTTGTRAYSEVYRHTEVIQRARFAMDTLARDIMSIYYLDETEYNRQIRQWIEETANQFADENFEPPREDEFENPYDRGILIDLAFVGEDRGDLDGLTFAIHEPRQLGGTNRLWGLARVNYSVDAGYLIRSTEDVTVPVLDFYAGEEIPKEEGATHTVVTGGVLEFDLAYAFWWDHQWFEIGAWNSSDRNIRSSMDVRGDYEEEGFRDLNNPTPTPQAQSQQELDRMEFNGVPAYLRMRLVLENPDNPDRPVEMTRLFRVPKSQETWLPNVNLDLDDREEEMSLRRMEMENVYPGALRRR